MLQPCPGCPGRHHTSVLQQPYTGPPCECVCAQNVCLTLLFASKRVCRNTSWPTAPLDRNHPFVFAPCSAGMGLAQPGTCPWAAVSWCLQRPSWCLACRAATQGFMWAALGWFGVAFADFAGRVPAPQCQVPSLLDAMPG